MSNVTLPTRSPLNELIEKLIQIPLHFAYEKVKQLAPRLTQGALEKVLFELKLKRDQCDQKVDDVLRQMINLCKQVINGPPIRIEIPRNEILLAEHSPQKLIVGKVIVKFPYSNSSIETQCVVASGNWKKLGGLKDHTLNIVDHLDQLIPTNRNNRALGLKKPIGLVTFQNGMQNSFDDFKKGSQQIVDQLPEAPFFVGLYNPTTGNIGSDMWRFLNEARYNPTAVYSLCQMIKTFADRLPGINPDLHWTHFAHSEGSLIANAVLTLCEESWIELKDARTYLKNHLITSTYGAVMPIPTNFVVETLNTYTKNDIALFFGQKYLDKPLDAHLIEQITENRPYESEKTVEGKVYKVQVIDSKTEYTSYASSEMPEILTFEQRQSMTWFEHLARAQELEDASRVSCLVNKKINDFIYWVVDHGFTNESYKNALKANIDDLREAYKIYDFKRNSVCL